jgi:hypothetical protein
MYDIIEGESLPTLDTCWEYHVADIAAAEGLDETGLPSEAYVPTANGEHAPLHPSQGYRTEPGAGNNTVFDAAGH